MSSQTIQFITGDATKPKTQGAKIIVHVCNDIGGWGKGFVLALSKKWNAPEESYREWFKTPPENLPFELGQVQMVEVEPEFWVANLIGQRGLKKQKGVPPVRYEAIQKGLQTVALFAKEKQASIHMPRIGCGLAGGKWDEMEKIIEAELVAKGLLVVVYDFK